MLIHIITICIGLIIAFGLRQIVAVFQRRRHIRRARDEARARAREREDDAARRQVQR